MRRRLIVMRHATAASGSGLPSDHVRPLTTRGTAEADNVGQQLSSLGWLPDLALVSDASRTSETWWCLAEHVGSPSSTMMPSFYGAGLDALVDALKRLPDDCGSVLVLGHNPGWSEAASWLSGVQIAMAPANAVCLEANGDRWTDVLGPGAMRLDRVVRAAV